MHEGEVAVQIWVDYNTPLPSDTQKDIIFHPSLVWAKNIIRASITLYRHCKAALEMQIRNAEGLR